MDYDAIVVGAGPNGLAGAIMLAEAGLRVLVLEAKETIGGGTRTLPLTRPGFLHDICSAIHPLGLASPFFERLDLEEYGLQWIQPPVALAHPFDDGTAAALYQDIEATAATLGEDGERYLRLFRPLVRYWQKLMREFLGPLRLPRYPLAMARFGSLALLPSTWLTRLAFRGEKAQGFFTGLSAHSIMDLAKPVTSSFGLMLAVLGHAVGWPLPRGGSQQITNALAAHLHSLGGQIETNHHVRSLDELPPHRVALLDVTPHRLLDIAGEHLPAGYRRQLAKYRYGPGVFKVDYALSEPIPWKNPLCHQAGTVHIGPTQAEIEYSERQAWRGRVVEKPYVLMAQQSLFDDTRAPAGQHTGWAYCHVPHGSTQDMTAAIEAQIERMAPGFRDCILERHTMNADAFEGYNPNYVGGDINSGVQDLGQLFTRPVPRYNPYATPLKKVFLCSSATPPGGGVHGMCGYWAAQAALKRL